MSIFLLLVSIALIIYLTVKVNLHPFLALFFVSLFYAFAMQMPFPTILTSIEDGFGGALGKIGLVIVMGIIIGAFLEHSGAAFKLAEVVLKLIGKKRVHAAMGIIGYIVSIPVFGDSGFIIINPLNKSLTKKAGLSLAGTGVALILGLMITHCMVPPTPGPIAAAGILNADVGLVMLVGLIVGAAALPVAIYYSSTYAAKTYIDPNPDLSEQEVEEKIRTSPGVFKSFLPIMVPILLIVGKSLIDMRGKEFASSNLLLQIIGFIGTPVIALTIGMFFSFLLPKKLDKNIISTTGWVGKALGEASNIILITGAGAIFGKILQNSGIADTLTSSLSGLNLGIWLPFILAAALKTAQGSSTVAIITTASILAPMAAGFGYDSELEKALLVVAIGAGSMVVSHANDSGFWVVTQLTGMDVKTGYKLYTLGTLIVGLFSAFVLFIGSMFIR